METVQTAGITGLIVIPESLPEPELSGAMSMGNPTRQVLPLENPVHPRELLATIYHGFGINPETKFITPEPAKRTC